MNIDFKRQILPHIIAIVAFVIITIGYFNPVFFENKELSQHDIHQWEGGARELLDYRDQTGEVISRTRVIVRCLLRDVKTPSCIKSVPAVIDEILSSCNI